MKFLPLIFLLATVSAVLAQDSSQSRQETESEGMKRIMNPTLNPVGDLQSKTFYGGAGRGFSTKTGNVKTFQWTDLFRLKTYTGSKKYGAKDYWTGNYQDGSKLAQTKDPYATRNVEVKTSPVNKDRDADKTQETRNYDKSRPYLVQGKSQKALDSQQVAQKPLTVDDVRELLNTTK